MLLIFAAVAAAPIADTGKVTLMCAGTRRDMHYFSHESMPGLLRMISHRFTIRIVLDMDAHTWCADECLAGPSTIDSVTPTKIVLRYASDSDAGPYVDTAYIMRKTLTYVEAQHYDEKGADGTATCHRIKGATPSAP